MSFPTKPLSSFSLNSLSMYVCNPPPPATCSPLAVQHSHEHKTPKFETDNGLSDPKIQTLCTIFGLAGPPSPPPDHLSERKKVEELMTPLRDAALRLHQALQGRSLQVLRVNSHNTITSDNLDKSQTCVLNITHVQDCDVFGIYDATGKEKLKDIENFLTNALRELLPPHLQNAPLNLTLYQPEGRIVWGSLCTSEEVASILITLSKHIFVDRRNKEVGLLNYYPNARADTPITEHFWISSHVKSPLEITVLKNRLPTPL